MRIVRNVLMFFSLERAELKSLLLFVEDVGLHLPRGAFEVKNPYMLKNVGTLEHYRTINEILITF